ncbi:hypothetical protein HD553DRAFT_366121 [Filobasidium floriforme]|uniref:uncharacterized protein n=1 Tax=Filobasidium floriforme TaxID=5210 RepID=UPI001E8D297B|nr:uncharacterized protein HD553DRAFT_366121 [Filobasidium floriforme]KAH8088258.1 hypothetical protein HD553DRAFT_366121 [Filobasidium floriforme]
MSGSHWSIVMGDHPSNAPTDSIPPTSTGGGTVPGDTLASDGSRFSAAGASTTSGPATTTASNNPVEESKEQEAIRLAREKKVREGTALPLFKRGVHYQCRYIILVPQQPGTDKRGYQPRCLSCKDLPPDESRLLCVHVETIAQRFGIRKNRKTGEMHIPLFFEYEPHNDVGTTWEKENFEKVCQVLERGTYGARQVKMFDTDAPDGNVLYDDNRKGMVIGGPLYAVEDWRLQEFWEERWKPYQLPPTWD